MQKKLTMDFKFDKDKHIKKMTPHVEKLVENFKKQGICFQSTDGLLENVIFKNNKKEVKISHHCFYRFSGMCKLQKESKKGFVTKDVVFMQKVDLCMTQI